MKYARAWNHGGRAWKYARSVESWASPWKHAPSGFPRAGPWMHAPPCFHGVGGVDSRPSVRAWGNFHPHTRQDGHTPDRTQGAVQAHTAKETLEAREHARQGESTSGNQTRNAIEAHNQQPPARTEQRARAQAASPRPAEATRCGPPLATATMAALARAITMDARSKNWC